MAPTGAAWAWLPGCRGRQDFSPGRTSRSMALGLQDRTGQSQAPLTAGKLGAGGPLVPRSVSQSPGGAPPSVLHPLESFVKKSNHPRPPNPPPARPLLKFLGWGARSELPGNKSISPQAPRAHWAIPEQNHSLPCFPLALTSPKPRPRPLTPSGPSWPPPAPRRANSLPSGKLLPLSQGAPSPPGASSPTPPHPPLQPLCPGGSGEAELFGTSRVLGAGGLPQLRDTRAEPGVGPSALVTCVHKAKDPAGATETPCSVATSSVTRGTDGARVAARSGHPPVPPEPLVHCAFFPDTCFLLIDTCV